MAAASTTAEQRTPGHGLPPQWPEGFGRLLGAALPEDILTAVQEESQAVSRSPNFWTSRVRRCGDHYGGASSQPLPSASEESKEWLQSISLQERLEDQAANFTACEAAIRHLQAAYMRHVLPDGWVGAEWWIQVDAAL